MTMGGSLLVFGSYAYYSKRSVPSLIASVVFGSAYLYSAHLIQSNKNPQLGHDIACVSSTLLMCAMIPRMMKNDAWKKASPPTIITVCAMGVLGYNAKKTMEWRAPAELDIIEIEIDKSAIQESVTN